MTGDFSFGSSGGAVYNEKSELIGVPSRITRSRGFPVTFLCLFSMVDQKIIESMEKEK